MANRTLEIFSGDVLQFGQGNTFDNKINILDFKTFLLSHSPLPKITDKILRFSEISLNPSSEDSR